MFCRIITKKKLSFFSKEKIIIGIYFSIKFDYTFDYNLRLYNYIKYIFIGYEFNKSTIQYVFFLYSLFFQNF